jgi:putative ABC transport system permease protein
LSWFSRQLRAITPGRVDRDLEAEMREHLEERTDEYARAGMPLEQARARARREFGNPLLLRESSHDVKVLPRIESILRDIGFGLRLWRRDKLTTAAALVSLSLAIGASTAAFSLIDALILRTLPVDDPRSLIHLGVRAPADTRDGLSFNYHLFRDLRDAGDRHVRLIALSDQRRVDVTFDDRGQPQPLYAQWISGDTFGLLGVDAALGRVLAATDDASPGQHPVAVLSYDLWRRRFGGDPHVLGRWVTIRDTPLQIVGVAAKGFTGVEPGIMTDLWAPAMMWDGRALSDPATRWLQIWGRVQPGVAPEQARALLQTVLTNFWREQVLTRPEESRDRLEQLLQTRVYVRSSATGVSALRENFARALWLLSGLAALVLLVACANVASLLAARAASREREMALRVSIGAGRSRLVQQVLLESGLLALASCALGAVLAAVMAPTIVSMMSTSRTIVRVAIELNWRLIAFLGCAGMLVTFLFGLAPAIRASRASPVDALKSGAARHTPRLGLFRPLVAAQVAFGFVVLFVACLSLTSFVRLLNADLGFDPSRLTLVTVASTAPASRPDEGNAVMRWERLIERVKQIPGIEAASFSRWALFTGQGRNKTVRIPGRPLDGYAPWYLQVSPGFFDTMRIPLKAGRDLKWPDLRPDTPTAVIVNESFARRYFPGESPLGRRFFRIDGGVTMAPQEVVGVAGDAKYTSLRDEAPPTVYDAYRPQDAAVIQLRTPLDPEMLAAILREELPRADPAFRLADVTPQSTLVGNHMVRDRALALLSAFFAFVATILVVVGLHGVLSYDLLQQTRDIGIRLALGAQPISVLASLLSGVGAMTIVGLIIGGIGAAVTGRFLTALLFEVRPSDAWSIAAPLTCLLLACASAALLPALRATRIDPTIALRGD